MALFFNRQKPTILGVDLSSTVVKLLELSKNGNSYCVESYSVEPLPENAVQDRAIKDIAAVGNSIARALKRAGTRAKYAACAVSGAAAITKIIQIPKGLNDDEILGQIESEADQYIPYTLAEVNLDFEVLGPSDGNAETIDVLLAAARTDEVDVRVAALAEGGLTAKVLDIEAFAIENAVNFYYTPSSTKTTYQTIAIFDIGATTTNLSVLKENRTIYSREQQFGGKFLTEEIQRSYGLSYQEAGMAKRHGGLPADYERALLNPFKETIALEINRALQFFYSSSQMESVDHIILAGGCASITGIKDILEAKTGISTEIANPFRSMSISSKVDAHALERDSPALMIAFGLALRGCE